MWQCLRIKLAMHGSNMLQQQQVNTHAANCECMPTSWGSFTLAQVRRTLFQGIGFASRTSSASACIPTFRQSVIAWVNQLWHPNGVWAMLKCVMTLSVIIQFHLEVPL